VLGLQQGDPVREELKSQHRRSSSDKHAGGYGHEYVDYSQPPSVNYKCPIDPGTPNDDCTPEAPCSIGEGPCNGRDTCNNGLRCGKQNCANFPGNSNEDANCCYDPYRPGEGDQFVFDVDTVLGQQMFKTLDWLDEADVETTVTCCNGKGDQVERKCGGRTTTSCKDVCGKGSRFHFAFDDFDNTECSSDLFYRNTNIWKVEDVCPAPKIWLPYTQTDYSTYKHQSLPSYVRGKRQSDDKECDSDEEGTCASQGVSIDLKYCVENELYTAEKIRHNQTNSAAWNRSSRGMPNDREVIRISRQLGMSVAVNTKMRQEELSN